MPLPVLPRLAVPLGVGSDEVPLDQIAVRAGRPAFEGDAVLPEGIAPGPVGRDQVAGAGVVPPIVLSGVPWMSMPLSPLPRALVPVASVPM